MKEAAVKADMRLLCAYQYAQGLIADRRMTENEADLVVGQTFVRLILQLFDKQKDGSEYKNAKRLYSDEAEILSKCVETIAPFKGVEPELLLDVGEAFLYIKPGPKAPASSSSSKPAPSTALMTADEQTSPQYSMTQKRLRTERHLQGEGGHVEIGLENHMKRVKHT